MGKIWDWHKKMFNSKEPVFKFAAIWDDAGNKDVVIEAFGSKFRSFSRVEVIEVKDQKQIEDKIEKRIERMIENGEDCI